MAVGRDEAVGKDLTSSVACEWRVDNDLGLDPPQRISVDAIARFASGRTIALSGPFFQDKQSGRKWIVRSSMKEFMRVSLNLSLYEGSSISQRTSRMIFESTLNKVIQNKASLCHKPVDG